MARKKRLLKATCDKKGRCEIIVDEGVGNRMMGSFVDVECME